MGDEGAKGWAAWESSQGVTVQTPAANGTSTPDQNRSQNPGDDGVITGQEGFTSKADEEEKGGWGEWVPLIPDTPQEPTSALGAGAAEAAPADLKVTFGVTSEMECALFGSDAVWRQNCIDKSLHTTRSWIA